jgi:hypothetical protein
LSAAKSGAADGAVSQIPAFALLKPGYGSSKANQEARFSVAASTLPAPAQTLQTIRLPRSLTRPVPVHRGQVFWTALATRLLWIEKRFPNVISEQPFVCANMKAD